MGGICFQHPQIAVWRWVCYITTPLATTTLWLINSVPWKMAMFYG